MLTTGLKSCKILVLAVIAVLGGLVACDPAGSEHSNRYTVVVFPFHARQASMQDAATELTTLVSQSLEGIDTVDLIAASQLDEGQHAENHHVWARDADIASIVEGSISINEDVVRVSAQVVDGQTGAHVWSELFESQAANPENVASQITTEIALSLKSTDMAHSN